MTGSRSARNPGTRVLAKAILPVEDAARAADFYARLGFEVESYDDTYAWVRHPEQE